MPELTPTIPPFNRLLQLATHQSWCNHQTPTAAPTSISELDTVATTAEATGNPPQLQRPATLTAEAIGYRLQPQHEATASATVKATDHRRQLQRRATPTAEATGHRPQQRPPATAAVTDHSRSHGPQPKPRATAIPTAKETGNPQQPR